MPHSNWADSRKDRADTAIDELVALRKAAASGRQPTKTRARSVGLRLLLLSVVFVATLVVLLMRNPQPAAPIVGTAGEESHSAAATVSASQAKEAGRPTPLPEPLVSVTQGYAIVVTGKRVPGGGRQVITPGQRVSGPNPAYPWEALQAGIEGEVRAQLTINENGVVLEVRILSGDKRLSDEVGATLGHWRYRPFRIEDRAVTVAVPVKVVFKLKPQG